MSDLTATVDAVLDGVVSSSPRVPGVVAVVTDRDRNIYEGARGQRVLGEDGDMAPDTVCAIFSTTKAITGTACLQLVESGDLDLDAPAKEYAPALGEVEVLDGFADDGTPQTRPPGTDITTRMLLCHTAGFGYDFFNANYLRLTQEQGVPSVISSSKASISTPLLFEPGSQWEYGSNIDWAGQVVEGITGKRLGEVFAERILGPLGMDDTSFAIRDDQRDRLAKIHQRADDGELTALELELPPDPEVHMGGHGLYSTALDYAKFIRMWLNDGGDVLKPETVRLAAENQLGEMKIKPLPGVIPQLSNDADFFPEMTKSWALTFMVNDEDAPTGRPAGALAWAGLANLYYWIDRDNGIGGFWGTQILPFADTCSVLGYLDMETKVYANLREPAMA